jgi:PhnB protein
MTAIQPELWVEHAADAIAFYQAAFGAVVVYRVGAGDDVVAQLAVDGVCFWIAKAGPDHGRFGAAVSGGATSRTLLVVDDPEGVVAAALAAGAAVTSPVADEHGWRLGRITDPAGQQWEVGHPLGRWPPSTSEGGFE